MTFTTLFMAHVPDADPERDVCMVGTEKYKLYVRLVRGQAQALDVCRTLVKAEGVQSIILCPGFTHKDIAEIQELAGPDVGITVARSDGPSSRIAQEAMKKAGWFQAPGSIPPRRHIINYEDSLVAGKYLVIAHGSDDDVAKAKSLLEETKPEELQEHTGGDAEAPQEEARTTPRRPVIMAGRLIVYDLGRLYFSWNASRIWMNCEVRRARASVAISLGTPP